MSKLPRGYFIIENRDGTSTLYTPRFIPLQVEKNERKPARYTQGFEPSPLAEWPTGKVHLAAPRYWAKLDKTLHQDNPGANRQELNRKLTRALSVGPKFVPGRKARPRRTVTGGN